MLNVKEKSLKYNLHSWSAQKGLSPKVITKAKGIYFWDDEGNRYYDMSSQLVNSNLGHGNKNVIQAIKNQVDKLPFISPGFAIDVCCKYFGNEKCKSFFYKCWGRSK